MVDINKWKQVESFFFQKFGKKFSIEGMLFLIGLQEVGCLNRTLEKEEKQDLIHVGTCKVLSYSGFYELDRIDEDGWQHFIQIKPLPVLTVKEQELFIKNNIIAYFDENLSS